MSANQVVNKACLAMYLLTVVGWLCPLNGGSNSMAAISC